MQLEEGQHLFTRVPVVQARRLTWFLSLKDLANTAATKLWQRSTVVPLCGRLDTVG